MKLILENWRQFLNEVIINPNKGRYGRPGSDKDLYATKSSLVVLLNTIKDYKDKGRSDKDIAKLMDNHVLSGHLQKYTNLTNGYFLTVDDYNNLVNTYLKNIDKTAEEVVDLLIKGELDKLSSASSKEPQADVQDETDVELEGFLKPRKVSSKDLAKFPLLQSVEDNMELFSYYKQYPDEMLKRLDELGFDIAGRGASRNAFFFKDNDKYVLKVANAAPADAGGFTTGRSEENLRDVRIGTNPDFQEFAPQVYAHDPEGRWFVVERTLPFKKPYTTFKNTFPELAKLTQSIKNEEVRKTFKSSPMFSLEEMLKAVKDEYYGGYAEEFLNIYKKLHRAALKKDPTYKNFYNMITKYVIDYQDLLTHTENWKNIGIGAGDGKLKITDPSTQGEEE